MGFFYVADQGPKLGRTARYILPLRAPHGPMTLVLEHLGESNRPFWLDQLARAKGDMALAAGAPNPKDMTPDQIAMAVEARRAQKRHLVAQFAVKALENVWHDDGTEAGPDAIVDFVFALPADVFDDVWQFCENPDNFRASPIVGDPSELAGK